jgi:predicted nucleic acid-binding protein
MPYFTYDTSVIISRGLTDFRGMPRNFLLSAIVLMELTASARDASQRKLYEELFRIYQKDDTLIVPNAADWLLTSKILFLLTHARRQPQYGRLKSLPPGMAQRLALDVLIAVSARRRKAKVVTDNWSDFKTIRRYCNATIIRGSDFFGT